MALFAEINQTPSPYSILQDIGRVTTPKLVPRTCLRYLQTTLIMWGGGLVSELMWGILGFIWENDTTIQLFDCHSKKQNHNIEFSLHWLENYVKSAYKDTFPLMMYFQVDCSPSFKNVIKCALKRNDCQQKRDLDARK